MLTHQLSKALDNLTDPAHNYYYPTQILLISSLSYFGTAVLNISWIVSTPPSHGMAFVLIAFATNKAVSPLFKKIFTPYLGDSLTVSAHRYLKWTCSILISKFICALFGINLKISQMVWITAAFLISYRVMRTALQKFRLSLSPKPISQMPIRNRDMLGLA